MPSQGRGGEHVSLSCLYLLETPSWALEREGQLQEQTLSNSERGEEGEMGVSFRSDTEATRCRLRTTQVSPAELAFAPEDGRCSAGLLVADEANVPRTDFHLALLLESPSLLPAAPPLFQALVPDRQEAAAA